jgi:hypothetical protein
VRDTILSYSYFLLERSAPMSKVVIADLKSAGVPRGTGTCVRKRRVHGSDGRAKEVMLLDLNSTTFDDDLTYVFEKNVAKARRENKRLLGSADGIESKK